jgi:hypothetical protein
MALMPLLPLLPLLLIPLMPPPSSFLSPGTPILNCRGTHPRTSDFPL